MGEIFHSKPEIVMLLLWLHCQTCTVVFSRDNHRCQKLEAEEMVFTSELYPTLPMLSIRISENSCVSIT